MKFTKKVLTALLIAFSISVSAQIEELTNHSDLVIEGEVLSTEANWNEDRTLIFTKNRVLVRSVFKGQPKDSIITINTAGGTVESMTQISTHETQLLTEDSGYFFINQDLSGESSSLSNRRHGFIKIVGKHEKTVISFGRESSKELFERSIVAVTKFPKLTYFKHEEIFSIQAFGGRDTCDLLSQARDRNTINFTFDSVMYTSNFQYLEFDIMAKVNTPGLKFGNGGLIINYDEAFGENIVANGSVEITKGEVLESPLYDLQYSDTSRNSVFVAANSSFGSNQLYTFTASAAELLHVKVKIADFTQLGTISFDSIDITGNVSYWCKGGYSQFDEVDLDGPITSTNNSFSTPIGITYSFSNPILEENNTKFKIDILARATASSTYSGGNVEVSYNTEAFGSNVIASGATFERGPMISNSSVYSSHFVQDVAMIDNVIQIFTFSDPATTSGRSTLGTTLRLLGTLTFNVLDCSADKGLAFDQFGTIELGNHLHYIGAMPIPNERYDPVIASDTEDGQLCGCPGDPVITSFAGPDLEKPNRIAAGMGEVLTILGDNFGASGPDSKIYFRNGDNGGIGLMEASQNDIISWNNTKIEIVVPGTDKDSGWAGPPCSGQFEVHNQCGNTKSATSLEIPYCILNTRAGASEKIALKDGLCIQFSSEIETDDRTTFRKAIEAWCAKLNMNIAVDYVNSASETLAAVDGISLVSKENPSTTGGVAGLSLNMYIESCAGESNVMQELDFKISSDALSGPALALENVLLHEIGHALMLNHSKKIGITAAEELRYAMYYDATNLNANNKERNIKLDDEEGAAKVFANSAQAIIECAGGIPIGTGNCNGFCGSNSIQDNTVLRGVALFPNPTSGTFTINSLHQDISGATLTIYSITGSLLLQQRVKNRKSEIILPDNMTTGVYILEIIHPSLGHMTKKIIIE